jgi:outer membrane receptor protein involved in Fe transport
LFKPQIDGTGLVIRRTALAHTLSSFFAVSFLVSLAFGGSTGKIAGVVKDKKSGDPLVGANVRLEGTNLGGATDYDGKYFIINLPPNDYVLNVTMVGYTPSKITGARVRGDLTTAIDVELSETILQVGQEVVVVAERPLVQKDLTAKTAIVSGQEISSLPVTEVGAVVSLQAGFVAGSLRGGRSGEVAYWIDGVPVTDAYNGTQIVEVNKSLVQELQVISGAFNAEYGQAMSGIVNITSKEGGLKYTGGIGIYGGDYLPSNDGIFPGNSFKATNIRNIEGNLSGPIVTNDLTFFANGRYIYFNGWQKGYRRFNPWNIPTLNSNGQLESVFPDGKGDSSVVPMNWSERYYAQGKLTWHLSSMMKFSVNYIYDDTKAKGLDIYGNYYRNYFYNPDGVGNQYNSSNTVIFQFNHSLSSSTFYTIGGSFFKKNYKYYLYDLQYKDSTTAQGDHVQLEVVDPYGPHYVDPNLSIAPAYSFMTGGTDPNKDNRSTQTGLIKFDLTSQVDEMNMVKFGVEYRSHNITNEHIELKPALSQTGFDPTILRPYIRTEIPDIKSPGHDYYEHYPKEFSVYAQDKMEYKNVIVNIGIRFDYFDPDGKVLNDAHPDTSDPLHYMYTVNDPSIDAPVRSDHFDVSQGGTLTLHDREQFWYKRASAKYAVSPRLGVSFPITDRGIVHFSYGHFFQIPHFERLYENPRFKINQLSSGIIGTMGNTDLKPEQTVSAELGVQQQLTEDIAFDATAYMRDIRGLTQTAIFDISGGGQYAQYTNKDFGVVKGIVLTVDKKFSGGITVRVDYTYQVVKGTASDPQQAKNALLGGALPDIEMVPLDWDQRHTLNVSLNYSANSWGVSSIFQYGSGSPYTPALQDPSTGTTMVTNSQIKPSSLNCDLRAYYEVNLSPVKLVFFTRIFNLFDTRNQKGVYPSTGRADYDWINEMQARSVKLYVNTVDQWFRDATKYSEPRRIEFGMNLEL